jgi:hypothetical protein
MSPTLAARRQRLSTASTKQPNPTTWVDRLPAAVRPYVYLTRIDKPIGFLTVYYPCGEYYTRCSTVVIRQNLQPGRSLWLLMPINCRIRPH